MMMTCSRFGTSPRPFNWNISIGEVGLSDRTIRQTTSCFDTRKLGGWNVRRLKNSFNRQAEAQTATNWIRADNGDALLGKHSRRRMDCSTESMPQIKSTGLLKTIGS